MGEFGEIGPEARPAGTDGATTGDDALISAALAGSETAAEALVERHWRPAYRIAVAIVGDPQAAEDVTQESMLALLAGFDRFDPSRPLEPWLHRIVANRSLDWIRSHRRRRRAEEKVAFERPAPERGPDPTLAEALAALPAKQRTVVVLRHIGGYGTGEIAQMLGLRRGTVGSRLRRGLDELRTRLEDDDG